MHVNAYHFFVYNSMYVNEYHFCVQQYALTITSVYNSMHVNDYHFFVYNSMHVNDLSLLCVQQYVNDYVNDHHMITTCVQQYACE